MNGPDDVAAVEAAVEDGPVHGPVELDVITASGPDAEEYLQGQLSQNVASLAVGETRWTLLLQPQGKVDAWMRVHRVDPERLWLLVDAGFGADALARLERFKLRVDVTMAVDRRTALGLRGPGSHQAAEEAGLSADVGLVDAGWGPIPGVDLVPDDDATAPTATPGFGLAADTDAMSLIRILQGRPVMGRELDASTIPAAATGVVEESVDFAKGCYVGQELVARIDSRGSTTPTRLVRFIGPAGPPPSPGSTLVVDGAEAGTVTSVARSPKRGLVGLAYVKRAVEVPGTAVVDSAGGAPVTVELIPLDRPTPSAPA